MKITQEYMDEYVIKPMAKGIADLMEQITKLDKKLDKTIVTYNNLIKQSNKEVSKKVK